MIVRVTISSVRFAVKNGVYAHEGTKLYTYVA